MSSFAADHTRSCISSRIEGTQVTVEDILEYETDLKVVSIQGRPMKFLEVMNYRKHLKKAVESLRYKPLTIDLIQELHRVLLTGVRGKNKDPGKIREIQKFIGRRGQKLKMQHLSPRNQKLSDLHSLTGKLISDRRERSIIVQLSL
jgi:Fic family protein